MCQALGDRKASTTDKTHNKTKKHQNKTRIPIAVYVWMNNKINTERSKCSVSDGDGKNEAGGGQEASGVGRVCNLRSMESGEGPLRR